MTHIKLKSALPRSQLQQLLDHGLGRKTEILRVSSCRGGLFNTSYRVKTREHGTLILRIAPPANKPLLRLEKHLLRREVFFTPILQSAGVPAPRVVFSDFSRRRIDRDYAITEAIEGHNWFYHQKKLAPAENERLFGELGEYARRIHATVNPRKEFGFPAPFKACKTWSDFMARHLRALARDTESHSLVAFPADIPLERIMDKMKRVLDGISVPRLVHGDLWQRNILIRNEGGRVRIVGLLDGDRAVWGDPRFEWVFFGIPMPDLFWKTYGQPKDVAGSQALRDLLYRACGAWQASLEQSLHFRNRKEAGTMMGYARKDFEALMIRLKLR